MSLGKSEPLKKPGRYADRADLLPRLQAVLAVRRVQVTRSTGGSLHRRDCHSRARRHLREAVDHHPKKLHRLALRRQRSHLAQLLGDKRSVLNRLAKLEEEISIAQMQVEALELSSRMTASDRCAQGSANDSLSDGEPVNGACGNAGLHVGSEPGMAVNA